MSLFHIVNCTIALIAVKKKSSNCKNKQTKDINLFLQFFTIKDLLKNSKTNITRLTDNFQFFSNFVDYSLRLKFIL